MGAQTIILRGRIQSGAQKCYQNIPSPAKQCPNQRVSSFRALWEPRLSFLGVEFTQEFKNAVRKYLATLNNAQINDLEVFGLCGSPDYHF